MKILFITTYYPPDTAIAAIRPFGLCENLSNMGHEVTVLVWGGSAFFAEGSMYEPSSSVRVISVVKKNNRKSGVKGIKDYIKNLYGKIRECTGNDIVYLPKYWVNSFKKFLKEREIITRLYKEGNNFDLVISSFGDAENILTGQYAAKLFACPLVQDFRDPLPKGKHRGFSSITTFVNKNVERWAIRNADVVTVVSHGMLRHMEVSDKTNFHVINNGYIPLDTYKLSNKDKVLKLCYTGTFYKDLDDLKPLFTAIKELIDEGKVEKDKILLNFAGKNFSLVKKQAESVGIEKIVNNLGYVSANEALKVQLDSDIFVVCAWNTVDDEGVICGKFFEGIRAHRPMLTVISGDLPNSELFKLNQKYNYGFCFENAQKEIYMQLLKKYIMKQYVRKINGEDLIYTPNNSLFTDFQYESLAKKMEFVCMEAFSNKKLNL